MILELYKVRSIFSVFLIKWNTTFIFDDIKINYHFLKLFQPSHWNQTPTLASLRRDPFNRVNTITASNQMWWINYYELELLLWTWKIYRSILRQKYQPLHTIIYLYDFFNLNFNYLRTFVLCIVRVILVKVIGQIHLVHLQIRKYFTNDSSVNFNDKFFLHF